MVLGAGVEIWNVDDVEVGLKVCSRDGISFGKYVKSGVNMIIDYSVCWSVIIGVGVKVKCKMWGLCEC